MSALAWLRNGLIFAGLAGGGTLAIIAAATPVATAENTEQVAGTPPITLNTARPRDLELVPFDKPLSLESGFGRGELTGTTIAVVGSLDPLADLPIDRRWDVNLQLEPPELAPDLPQVTAKDEVTEPERRDDSLVGKFDLSGMPDEARQKGEQALDSLTKGTEMLKRGMHEFRQPGEPGKEGRRKIKEAANLLREARDRLDAALKIVPNHPELVRMMQEAKANLYICMKHGMD